MAVLKKYEIVDEIGHSGGYIEINNPESPINSTRILIPPGALNETQLIKINNRDNIPIDALKTIGSQSDFAPDGLISNQNVQIGLKYKDEDSDGYVDGTTIDESNLIVVFDDTSNSLLEIK